MHPEIYPRLLMTLNLNDYKPKPSATYRLQLNHDFNFADARAVVPYLSRLGISHVYLSPIVSARPGSVHCYDGIDPGRINPELGGEYEFQLLVEALHDHRMGIILDIVPNHLAIHIQNPYVRDVLIQGPDSRFADMFDIFFDEHPRGKIVLPFLGQPLVDAIRDREITLEFKTQDEVRGFCFCYYEHRFPLSIVSTLALLGCFVSTDELLRKFSVPLEPDTQAFRQQSDRTRNVYEHVLTMARDDENVRVQLKEIAHWINGLESTAAPLPENLQRLIAQGSQESAATAQFQNGPDRLRLLTALTEFQNYELGYWKTHVRNLNYRRFFNINHLIGVRVEDEAVFQLTHRLYLDLLREKAVQGLRVDHIDGLRDPAAYLQRLHAAFARAGQPPWILVEKILGDNEYLPRSWHVQGATGYEFLNHVNRLSTSPSGFQQLAQRYRMFNTGETIPVVLRAKPFARLDLEARRRAALRLFPAELDRLARRFTRLARESRVYSTEDVDSPDDARFFQQARKVIAESIAHLSVYRTYHAADMETEQDHLDRQHWLGAIHAARESIQKMPARRKSVNRALREQAFNLLEYICVGEHAEYGARFQPRRLQPEQADLLADLQQLSGAIIAKGHEDTALYRHALLVSQNEVGGEPALATLSTHDFHRFNAIRFADWPLSLNVMSTHDTKRSADVRARIQCIADTYGDWARLEETAAEFLPVTHKNGYTVPHPILARFFWQSLLGFWPLADLENTDYEFESVIARGTGIDDSIGSPLRNRMRDYMQKVIREARVHTSWVNPDSDYEDALLKEIDDAIAKLIESESRLHHDDRSTTPGEQDRFAQQFLTLAERLAIGGARLSLAWLTLACMCPGVPDIYQGGELWNFSLVDPDNRRRVDFRRREKILQQVVYELEHAGDWHDSTESPGQGNGLPEWLRKWPDGKIKMYALYRLLQLRREHPDLFVHGSFEPLITSIPEEAIAFLRRSDECVVLIAARTRARSSRPEYTSLRYADAARVSLPEGLPLKEGLLWQDILRLRNISLQSGQVDLPEDGLPLILVHKAAPEHG